MDITSYEVSHQETGNLASDVMRRVLLISGGLTGIPEGGGGALWYRGGGGAHPRYVFRGRRGLL